MLSLNLIPKLSFEPRFFMFIINSYYGFCYGLCYFGDSVHDIMKEAIKAFIVFNNKEFYPFVLN